MDIFTRLLNEYHTKAAVGRVCGAGRKTSFHWFRKRDIPPQYWRPLQDGCDGRITIMEFYNALYPPADSMPRPSVAQGQASL